MPVTFNVLFEFYSLHSPLLSTETSFFSTQALDFIEHSLLYVLPSDPHTGSYTVAQTKSHLASANTEGFMLLLHNLLYLSTLDRDQHQKQPFKVARPDFSRTHHPEFERSILPNVRAQGYTSPIY